MGNTGTRKGQRNADVVEVPSTTSKKSSVMSDTTLNLTAPKPQQIQQRMGKLLEHKNNELFNATVKNKSATSTSFSSSKVGSSTAKNESLI